MLPTVVPVDQTRQTAERETAGQGMCAVSEFPRAAVTKYREPEALIQ